MASDSIINLISMLKAYYSLKKHKTLGEKLL